MYPSLPTILAANSTFNVSDTIEIAANVTDNVAVANVTANITYPNGTIATLTLDPAVGDKYNTSFTIPALLGQYNVSFFANDTSGNINNTETTFFVGVDQINPAVRDITPVFNVSITQNTNTVISVNVTDNVAVD